jgi:hypothetical protein
MHSVLFSFHPLEVRMSRQFSQSDKHDSHSSSSATKSTRSRQRPELVIQRAQVNPSSLTPSDVLTLQRSIGNRATTRLLSPILQTKLKLGPAGDKYEQEADRVAEQVVRQSEQGSPDVQRSSLAKEEIQAKPLSESISRVQRSPIEEEELQMKRIQRAPIEEEELQMKRQHGAEGGEVESSVEQQIHSARGGGQPLEKGVRRQMERGFGASFKGVRVHTNQQADTLNRSLNARAFTVGNDLFFRSGEYKPGSSNGKQLLAHELTHTIQQSGGESAQRKSEPVVQRISWKATKRFVGNTFTKGIKSAVQTEMNHARIRAVADAVASLSNPNSPTEWAKNPIARPYLQDVLAHGFDRYSPEIYWDFENFDYSVGKADAIVEKIIKADNAGHPINNIDRTTKTGNTDGGTANLNELENAVQSAKQNGGEVDHGIFDAARRAVSSCMIFSWADANSNPSTREMITIVQEKADRKKKQNEVAKQRAESLKKLLSEQGML